MALDPVHGHAPWALVLVRVSLQEILGQFGVWGQPSNHNSRSPSGSFTEGNQGTGKKEGIEVPPQAVHLSEGSLTQSHTLIRRLFPG